MSKLDPNLIRKDFPMYNEHNSLFQGKPLVYLDNSATTFKPYCALNALKHYYCDITSNTRRGDYSLAYEADSAFEHARKTVANFINADAEEIAFSSGDTMSLNEIAYGLVDEINEGDEILLSYEEHASNALPWFKIAKYKKANIKYVELTNDYKVTIENFKKALSNKTKIVSLASVSNVLGNLLPVNELVSLTHKKGAIYIDDSAQTITHHKIDVKKLDVDFLTFSGHKILGPTGIGVLYGKKEMLEKLHPLFYGGEMNARYDKACNISLDDIPFRLEAGTQNIEGVLGLEAALNYIDSIGYDSIYNHVNQLRQNAENELSKIDNCLIYNKNSGSNIITFNIKNVFAQDMASFLSHKGIFVRSGQHCSKLLPEIFNTQGTIRASFYIYNNMDDVNALVEACKHSEDYLDAFFD